MPESRFIQPLCLRLLPFGSESYAQALCLRDEVLRKPLGHSVYEDDRSGEPQCWHLGAYAGDRLIGTLMLVPLDARTVQMRQVAVAPAAQGQQVGTRLVRYAETFARGEGICTIVLHARQTAVPFYQKLGYAVSGSGFTEVGIPHLPMQKEL